MLRSVGTRSNDDAVRGPVTPSRRESQSNDAHKHCTACSIICSRQPPVSLSPLQRLHGQTAAHGVPRRGSEEAPSLLTEMLQRSFATSSPSLS